MHNAVIEAHGQLHSSHTWAAGRHEPVQSCRTCLNGVNTGGFRGGLGSAEPGSGEAAIAGSLAELLLYPA